MAGKAHGIGGIQRLEQRSVATMLPRSERKRAPARGTTTKRRPMAA